MIRIRLYLLCTNPFKYILITREVSFVRFSPIPDLLVSLRIVDVDGVFLCRLTFIWKVTQKICENDFHKLYSKKIFITSGRPKTIHYFIS